MQKTLGRLILSSVVLVLFGCAAGSGGPTTYREQLGMATPGDLAQEVRRIIEEYHYEMETEDSSITYQVYQTRWKGRTPFQDELDSGVVEAMTKFTVTGRARGGGSTGAANVRVAEFVAENRVRYAESGEWNLGLYTPMFREYAKDISGQLRARLTSGIRVY